MSLTVGMQQSFHGNVTTLNWIGAREAALIERNLGYHAGRLAQGYWIVLLKTMLTVADFEFDGTTLRSGGKLGLPQGNPSAEAARKRVHDQIIAERGQAGYQALQQHALGTARISGPNRIAKVIPATGHNPAMGNDLQYPMGGGGLQWKIVPPGKPFLVAMHVDGKGIAHIPGASLDLGPKAPYENRAKVARYLESA